MEIKAVLKKINPTISRNGFDSRKIWLTLDPQGKYPQTVEVEASGNNLNLFNNVAPGTWVTCQIDLRGREWTGSDGIVKVFNTISVWKVSVAGNEVNSKTESQTSIISTSKATTNDNGEPLPF